MLSQLLLLIKVKKPLGLRFTFGDMQLLIYWLYAKEQVRLDLLTNDLQVSSIVCFISLMGICIHVLPRLVNIVLMDIPCDWFTYIYQVKFICYNNFEYI